MNDIHSAIGFATISFAVAISPGPSWIYVVSSTVEQGCISGIIATVGNATGILLHVAMATFGLSVVFQHSIIAFTIVKWLGAAYFIYLAIRTIRNDSILVLTHKLKHRHLKHIFLEGVLINVLNPKVYLLILALLPQFINPSYGNIKFQIVFLGLFHVFIASVVLTTIVFSVRRVMKIFKYSKTFQKIFCWFSGSILFGFGVKLALANNHSFSL